MFVGLNVLELIKLCKIQLAGMIFEQNSAQWTEFQKCRWRLNGCQKVALEKKMAAFDNSEELLEVELEWLKKEIQC